MKGNRKPRRNRFSDGRTKEKVRDNARCAEEQRDYDKATNDISWYSRYPNLLISAGQFPYPYRPGMSIDLGTVTTAETTPRTLPRFARIPGVMTLEWFPSLGTSNYNTDPISVAAKEIYARVRQAYSGALDADGPDFIMYLASLDSIFSYIAWLKRLYRLLVAWSPDNYVIPDVILTSMGINPTEANQLRANRTRLWQVINELILQSRKFTCPALMDVFNRHYWMSDNVYTDEQSINSQFYVFNLAAVYKFKEQPVPGQTDIQASGLELVVLPSSGAVDDYYQFGLGLIQALVDWDEAYTINGYLKRAYDGVPTFTVDELPQDQPFNPVYVPEVLVQIENSRTIPTVFGLVSSNLTGFAVAQDPSTNAVIVNPSVSIGGTTDQDGEVSDYGYTIPPMLSIRSDAPTVADSVIASRLNTSITLTSGTNNTRGAVYAVHCGTEVAWRWTLWTLASAQPDEFWGGYKIPSNPVFGGTSKYTYGIQNLLVEQFDWHPFSFITVIPAAGDDSWKKAQVYPSGDTHNLTTISLSDLDNLHRVCLFSEFNAFNA